ncbi:6-phosphofructo-2-kinase-domain-containing protein [Radiomyces spectabilis]|uniref:6-phosphofructo-2-kinase-domain-containing protein n=1 Tax=Radiomyces spectabilis TaxID=64574 RepID=UPI002220CDBE|nr:6-phosphofructo-2-kinase-domain-containing protein [Radiomyces spectabilis]KAI8370639.1 6-phosphofructo-2-kinase-domain-containing protein [Radiomyces spectabilis]
MAAQLYKTENGRLFHAGAVAIITVGLPARGKTHVSRSLCRYMRWMGVSTKVFSVGNYRRERLRTIPEEYFDPNNKAAFAARIRIADDCLDDLIEWLQHGGGQVAIYDGNNVTEERRREIHDKLVNQDIHPLFIESICNKPEIVLANIRSVKISSPDYVGWEPEEAVKDYTKRIEQHKINYETIADLSLPFVKLMNVGEQLIVNNVQGYLQSRVVYYLMNLHNRPRTIYFARAGESLNPNLYKVDAELSPEGRQYAENLKNFMIAYREKKRTEANNSEDQERPLSIWTSTRKKSRQSALPFAEAGFPVRQHSVLTQLNPGEVDGLTPEEIKQKFPEEVARARQDPYRHRYPRAESYHDLAIRLESIIMELEREKNDVLIIAHDTVLRCLYAYLFDRPESEIPTISIPRPFLVEITPTAYGCKETRMEITPESCV